MSHTHLYAGGNFTSAGGAAANYIAKWNGSSWSALGSGMDQLVWALAVSGNDLYAGGRFTNAGGTSASLVAKWDGTNWTALGSGIGNDPLGGYEVDALAVSGSDLYVGGWFTTAGGIGAKSIAKWNGSAWSILGSGMSAVYNAPSVLALMVWGNSLYAGGFFDSAGGNAARNIARWDGSGWSAMGSGTEDAVRAFAAWGGNLYAGGQFTTVDGSPVFYITKWNGSSWSALGSGMNGIVWTMAVSDNDLYAGGSFVIAGGKLSGYVARAYLPTLPGLSLSNSGTEVLISWRSADTGEFTLEQAHALTAPGNWTANTASVTDDGTNKSVTLPATNSAQVFRLRRP